MSIKSLFYTVTVEYEYEHTIRGVFGWIEGHGPGCGDWRKRKATLHILAPDELYVRQWVERHYQKKGRSEIIIDISAGQSIDVIISVQE